MVHFKGCLGGTSSNTYPNAFFFLKFFSSIQNYFSLFTFSNIYYIFKLKKSITLLFQDFFFKLHRILREINKIHVDIYLQTTFHYLYIQISIVYSNLQSL